MVIKLISGTLDSSNDMSGWIVTSQSAIAEGAEDMPLQKGDRVSLNGDVWRGDELLGNIA